MSLTKEIPIQDNSNIFTLGELEYDNAAELLASILSVSRSNTLQRELKRLKRNMNVPMTPLWIACLAQNQFKMGATTSDANYEYDGSLQRYLRKRFRSLDFIECLDLQNDMDLKDMMARAFQEEPHNSEYYRYRTGEQRDYCCTVESVYDFENFTLREGFVKQWLTSVSENFWKEAFPEKNFPLKKKVGILVEIFYRSSYEEGLQKLRIFLSESKNVSELDPVESAHVDEQANTVYEMFEKNIRCWTRRLENSLKLSFREPRVLPTSNPAEYLIDIVEGELRAARPTRFGAMQANGGACFEHGAGPTVEPKWNGRARLRKAETLSRDLVWAQKYLTKQMGSLSPLDALLVFRHTHYNCIVPQGLLREYLHVIGSEVDCSFLERVGIITSDVFDFYRIQKAVLKTLASRGRIGSVSFTHLHAILAIIMKRITQSASILILRCHHLPANGMWKYCLENLVYHASRSVIDIGIV